MFPNLALAREADAVAVVDTGRDLHLQGLVLLHATLTMAAAARVANHTAAPVTARAGLLQGKEALLHTHLSRATAGSTRDGTAALGGARTFAGRAHHQRRFVFFFCGVVFCFFFVVFVVVLL